MRIKNIITANSFGTLITPSGTFLNVLRVKSVSTMVTKVGKSEIKNRITSYLWLNPNIRHFLMMFSYNSYSIDEEILLNNKSIMYRKL